jgi:4-hydroxy-4-methyl-2-oxoglutarate aldolase
MDRGHADTFVGAALLDVTVAGRETLRDRRTHVRYRIRTRFDRPDPALVARAAALNVGIAGFVLGPRQVCDPAIKPLRADWRVCGPAFTVRPERTDDLLMGEVAAKYAQPGDVLVVDAAGRTDTCCWGMGMSTGARAAGCAGVVLDGACMNGALLTVERVQLPIFARGLVAGGGGAEHPGWLNEPSICGGVIVWPGDVVLGDCDGVVVIPSARLAEVVATAEGYVERARAAADVPYHERKGSVEKLRARSDVEWQ